MRLGLTSAAFYGRLETEEAAAHLQKLGLDCCEVFLETFSEYTPDFASCVHACLQGLPCVSVHPKGTQFEPDFFGQSARQRNDAFHLINRVMDAGQTLNARYYVMHGPVSVIGRITLDRIRRLEEQFTLAQQAAQAHGMEILWENVYYGAVSSVEDFRRIRERLPELNFVLDVKQSWRGNIDPNEIVREVGGWIRHVHILDHDADGNLCLPGEGIFDLDLFLRLLRDKGYPGDIIIEPYANLTVDAARLSRSIEYMHELLDKLGE